MTQGTGEQNQIANQPIREMKTGLEIFKALVSMSAVAVMVALITLPIPALAEETARMDVEPAEGPVGTTVHVTGEGFEPQTEIVISFKTKDNKVGEVDADEAGWFDICFTVEDCPVGVYSVWATAVATAKVVSSHFTVQPEITVSKSSGYVGDEITLGGSGFAARKDITIYFENDKVGTSKTSDDGTFTNVTFHIPNSCKGEHSITAEDTDHNFDSTSFSTKQSISLDPKSGSAGAEVTLSGTGFGAKKEVIVYFDNDKVGESETDAKGSFADATFHIPRSCKGEHSITAEDSEDNSDSALFSTRQSISLNPESGSAGTEVTISGTGFAANSNITITFDAEKVARHSSDENGSFTGVFVVPSRPGGVYYNVKASDGKNVDYADFTIVPGASLGTTSGYVGMGLDVKGTSFPPDEAVIIRYGDTEVATATTTNDGAFSTSFIVPKGTHGDHAIDVTDGTNTVELTFTMESTPPPVPTLVSPLSGSKTEAQAYLDWDSVEDPSGVTYTLEIASATDFSTLVLTKKGLTDSEYTITVDEKLPRTVKGTLYCWRVKAIDGASNASEWSTSRSFRVGFSFAMPAWTKYSLIGLGIVLALFLCFWAGRQILYHALHSSQNIKRQTRRNQVVKYNSQGGLDATMPKV